MHIIHSLRRGGAERVALNLARGMVKSGHEVCVVSLLDLDDYDDIDRTKAEVRFLIPAASYNWPSSCFILSKRLHKEILTFRPSVILTHTPTATIVLGLAGAKCPTLSVFHGYGDMLTRKRIKQHLFAILHDWALRRVKAEAVVVCNGLADVVRQRVGIPAMKIRCIPNGIDLEKFIPRPVRTLIEPDVLVIGTLSEVKRPLDAVSAFSQLLEMVPGAKLTFVGDGPLRGDVVKSVARLGLKRKIRFLGLRKDVPELLRTAALVWQLSRSEGMPLACIEAMACAVPVIATRVGGIPELIRHGVTGFVVDVGDTRAVATISAHLLGDQELYANISAASTAFARDRFDQRKMVASYLEIIEELVQGATVVNFNRGARV